MLLYEHMNSLQWKFFTKMFKVVDFAFETKIKYTNNLLYDITLSHIYILN